MLTDSFVEAFNSRVEVNSNTLKTMSAGQQERVVNRGRQAEELIKNRELALFIHTAKIELAEQLSGIGGHSTDDNNKRIALSNQLSGLDSFVDLLKRSIYYKNLVVKSRGQVVDTVPTDIT